MKQTNLSLAGIIFGSILTLSTWIRYFILRPDVDKALFFGLIGLIIIVVSWNYAGRVELNNKIDSVKQTLNAVEERVIDEFTYIQ